jgi:hypothetical protein
LRDCSAGTSLALSRVQEDAAMFEDDPMIDEMEDGFDDNEDRVIDEEIFLGEAAQDAWEWATEDDDIY